jgi:tight adherence protein B
MSGSTIRLIFLASFVMLVGLAAAALLIDNANRARKRLAGRIGRVAAPSSRATAPRVALAVAPAGPLERAARLIGCDYQRRSYYPVPWWIVPVAAAPLGYVAARLAGGLFGAASIAVLPAAWFFACRATYGRWNNKRRDTLLTQFPDALSMIVRTVRVGIPVVEGVRVVGREIADPTGAEFRQLAEEIAIGMPVDAALRATAERTGLAEYRFFATAVSLQMQTGGGLADALDTLADVVRRRLALRDRGFAMTSEARTSALILGLMPLFVGGLMTVSSPGYLNVLFTTEAGKKMLVIGGFSLFLGIATMRMLIRRTLAS